jgi:hypothetical protein
MIRKIKDLKHFEVINNTQFLREVKNIHFADFEFEGKYYVSTI